MADKDLHPYLNAEGEHVVGGEPTGWVFADATRQAGCPRCGSSAGFCCQSPSGERAKSPHKERVQAYLASVPAAAPAKKLRV